MNAEPHTHEVKLRHWAGGSHTKWVINYGDQERTVSWIWGRFGGTDTERFRRKVKRATMRAVAKHDRKSQEAGARERIRLEAQREAQRSLTSRWVSSK